MAELFCRALTRMPQPLDFHQLSQADLTVLARSDYSGSVIRRLNAIELSRNILMLEAVRRSTRPGVTGESPILEPAVRALRAAQAHQPDVVAEVLALPNFGLWAANALLLLRSQGAGPANQSSMNALQGALAHLDCFAAVAAIAARESCTLGLPVRNDRVFLPSLGYIRVPAGAGDCAQFTTDGQDMKLKCGAWTCQVSIRDIEDRRCTPDWTPVLEVTVASADLTFSVNFEISDPLLAQLAPSTPIISPDYISRWERCLNEAWQLLANHHQPIATALSRVVKTIVPANEVNFGNPVSATSGWAWGALILSLPADGLSLAEALVHELHHLVLSAVEDVAPLVTGSNASLFYAPWREDPRPLPGLLHGAYSFLGVTDFWLRELRAGPSSHADRAQLAFAQRRLNVSEALTQLRDCTGLTDVGRMLVAQMAFRAAEWTAEPVHPSADVLARSLNDRHRERWLRAHSATQQLKAQI